MGIRTRIMFVLCLAFALLIGAFLWNDNQKRRHEIQNILARTSESFEKLIASEIRASLQSMETTLDSLSRDRQLIQTYEERNRKKLIEYSEGIFKLLKTKYMISHMYFHDINRVNFLRLHEFDHFGDLIERQTLKDTQSTGLPSYGIEQGPTGASVLRYVFPLKKNKNIVGFVELGVEFQDIVRKIEDVMGLRSLVLAEKKAVKRDKWENRNNKNDFHVEWDFLPDHAVMASSFKNIPNELQSLQILSEAKSSYVVSNIRIDDGETHYNVFVMPIRNSKQQKVADIVALYDSSKIVKSAEAAMYIAVSVTAIIAVFLLLFFYFYLGAIERLLAQQQASLISQSKMASVGEMAGGIAHEINTPLTAIILHTQLIQNTLQDLPGIPQEVFEKTHRIVEVSERVAKIIQGLRAFSRQTSQDEFEDFTVDQLVTTTLDLCQQRLANSGIELKVNKENMRIPIRGNSVQLSQVLLNLINNSFDAVQKMERPWIEIDCTVKGKKVMLMITDSGHGIPEKHVEKLFQPFFTTKNVGVGTGLGLSISKGIVEQHGGHLYYDKTSNYTRFIVELPLSKA